MLSVFEKEFYMKKSKLTKLIFMALCAVLGLFAKKLINPFANLLTDSLHIPGGISTGFSLMFLVIAAELVQLRRCGSMMGAVQGALALISGRVGSMGALMPLGYLMPGIVIDLLYPLTRSLSREERMAFSNMAAAVTASLTANLIVFHLWGVVLCLYLTVSAVSGLLWGLLGAALVKRLKPILLMI